VIGDNYFCRPTTITFAGWRLVDRDAFVAHLRTAHHTAPARIPDLLLVRDGRLHFVGE